MPGSPPHPHRDSWEPGGPDDLYASPPPWDIGRPQPAFLALADAGAIWGRVLDVGCGTGEHVLMCAGLGLDATGVDLAAAALHAADAKARDRGLTARFLRWDARKLADLGESFDTVLDCGLFHGFNDDDRAACIGGLRSVTAPGSRYFMLCFSDQEPGGRGQPMRAGDAGGDQSVVRRRVAGRLDRPGHDRHHHRPGRRPGLADRSHQDLSSRCPERNAMPTAEARIETEHASRYLVRLCQHISKITNKGPHLRHQGPSHLPGTTRTRPDMQAHAEWTETHGIVTFSWGKITLQASPGALTLHAEAADEENLRQVQDLIAGRLAKFGSREHLTVNWRRTETPAVQPRQVG